MYIVEVCEFKTSDYDIMTSYNNITLKIGVHQEQPIRLYI